MSFVERIQTIMKRKIEQQDSYSLISDGDQQFPIQRCKQKLFQLILKLEQSKAKQRNQYPVPIRQRIFVGNYIFASDGQFLKKHKIGTILSCMSTSPVRIVQGIKYEKIPLKDQNGQDLLQYEQKIFDFVQDYLNNETTNIYIHCFHGKSRCVSVAMMYLMRKQGKSANNLLSQIKIIYPKAQPNSWFMQQLKQFERILPIQFNKQVSPEAISPKRQVVNQQNLLQTDVKQNSQNSTKKQQNLLDIHYDNHSMAVQQTQKTKANDHLLIPQHQKTSPRQQKYDLIEMDEDEQGTINNLKQLQSIELI